MSYESERDEAAGEWAKKAADRFWCNTDFIFGADWANARAEKVIEKHIEYGAFQLNERVKSDNALASRDAMIEKFMDIVNELLVEHPEPEWDYVRAFLKELE